MAILIVLCLALAAQGCFDPVYPQLDREARVAEALVTRDTRPAPPSPLTPADAVIYALANNLEAKVAEIEIAYQNESLVAARRRMLPSLTVRYSLGPHPHPVPRWA
ncbi:MAG: hypothetical protein LIP77_11615, partial [Planctomycetes bacterium]|nr:hypothetical protein [Planctomycetota bacterium]